VSDQRLQGDGPDTALWPAPPTWWERLAGVRAGVRELLFCLGLYVAYSASRLLASNDMDAALDRGRQLLRLEQPVLLDFEHWLNRLFLEHDVIGILGSFWYSGAHYLVTLGVLVWLWFRCREAYLQARRALIVGTLIALALYLLLPTAPPRFFAEYQDVLVVHSDVGWWGSDASAPKGMGHLTNQLAAFPSLHCGWSLWVALVVHKNVQSALLRAAAWAGAATTAIVVIGTGNHWTLDVVVGWIVVITGVVSVSTATGRPTLVGSTAGGGDHRPG